MSVSVDTVDTLLDEIKSLTSVISCDKVHGLGSLNDISRLLLLLDTEQPDITSLLKFSQVAEELNTVIQDYLLYYSDRQSTFLYNDLVNIKNSLLSIELMIEKYLILANRINNKERRLNILLDKITNVIDMVSSKIEIFIKEETVESTTNLNEKISNTQMVLDSICLPATKLAMYHRRLANMVL